jgi:Domain of unknown function (DUF4178)
MFLFVSLLTLGIIIGAVIVIQRQPSILKESKKRQQLLSEERTVFNLKIGDIVQYIDKDWVVEGKLTYRDNGYTWFEYLLQDDNEIRWLSVDEDDRVEVAFLESTNFLDVEGTPPKQLSFVGDTYQQKEKGQATMSRTGTTLRRTAQICQYFDYEGQNDKVLSIEFWDGEYEVTVGQRINPRALILLPGDGRSVYR